MSDRLAFALTHRCEDGRPVVELVEPVTLQGFTASAGFTTDFASIPAGLRGLLPVFGRSCRAAVLHDWLCHVGYDKAKRSRLFLVQMREDRVPAWQAWLQWAAVRFWPGTEQD